MARHESWTATNDRPRGGGGNSVPPAVAEWARGKRVFILSVMAELPEKREVEAAAARTVGATPVMFELLGGRDADPRGRERRAARCWTGV